MSVYHLHPFGESGGRLWDGECGIWDLEWLRPHFHLPRKVQELWLGFYREPAEETVLITPLERAYGHAARMEIADLEGEVGTKVFLSLSANTFLRTKLLAQPDWLHFAFLGVWTR